MSVPETSKTGPMMTINLIMVDGLAKLTTQTTTLDPNPLSSNLTIKVPEVITQTEKTPLTSMLIECHLTFPMPVYPVNDSSQPGRPDARDLDLFRWTLAETKEIYRDSFATDSVELAQLKHKKQGKAPVLGWKWIENWTYRTEIFDQHVLSSIYSQKEAESRPRYQEIWDLVAFNPSMRRDICQAMGQLAGVIDLLEANEDIAAVERVKIGKSSIFQERAQSANGRVIGWQTKNPWSSLANRYSFKETGRHYDLVIPLIFCYDLSYHQALFTAENKLRRKIKRTDLGDDCFFRGNEAQAMVKILLGLEHIVTTIMLASAQRAGEQDQPFAFEVHGEGRTGADPEQRAGWIYAAIRLRWRDDEADEFVPLVRLIDHLHQGTAGGSLEPVSRPQGIPEGEKHPGSCIEAGLLERLLVDRFGEGWLELIREKNMTLI